MKVRLILESMVVAADDGMVIITKTCSRKN